MFPLHLKKSQLICKCFLKFCKQLLRKKMKKLRFNFVQFKLKKKFSKRTKFVKDKGIS